MSNPSQTSPEHGGHSGDSPVFELEKFDADSLAGPWEALAHNSQRLQNLPVYQAYQDALAHNPGLLVDLQLRFPDIEDESLLEIALEDINMRRAAAYSGEQLPESPKPDGYTDEMCAAELFGLPDMAQIDAQELFNAATAYATTKALLLHAVGNQRTINEQRALQAAVDSEELNIPSFEDILRAAKQHNNTEES